jgi:P2-related tail formation protein
MKLKDVDLYKMLPTFMKEDRFDRLLSEGMSNLFSKLAVDMDRAVIIGYIDELNEAELDQLAKDWNVFWYLKSASLEQKRQLIKDSPLVFSRLGTVWAVERVMNNYLPESELKEWFDYNGKPHYFRFVTNNTDILQTDIDAFLFILEQVKRKSQWLDGIILELRAKGTMFPGVGFIEESTDTFNFLIE